MMLTLQRVAVADIIDWDAGTACVLALGIALVLLDQRSRIDTPEHSHRDLLFSR
jgi:hypothetical protein